MSIITRAFIILGLSTILAACGTDAGWQNMRLMVMERFKGTPEPPMTRQEINDIPYAMLMARFGREAPAVLVLTADEPRGQQWMSANNASIVTRKGRLIRTVGLGIDLRDSYMLDDDPLDNNPQLLSGVIRYQRYFEQGDNPPQISVLDCQITSKGQEVLTIVELDFQVIRLEEKCKTKGWKFKNIYWRKGY